MYTLLLEGCIENSSLLEGCAVDVFCAGILEQSTYIWSDCLVTIPTPYHFFFFGGGGYQQKKGWGVLRSQRRSAVPNNSIYTVSLG
jgi:hypothetical protein